MQGLPAIGAGHFLYVFLWALVGMSVGAIACTNRKTSTYKDYLAGTLGISLEAVGVELLHRQHALIVPLASSLLFALLIGHLPDERGLRIRHDRSRTRRLKSATWIMVFFWGQLFVLLLAYRGWWDQLVLYPGV